MTNQLKTIHDLEKTLEAHLSHRHLTQAADGIFMAAFRNGVKIERMLTLIENGEALDKAFFTAKTGNLLDFVAPELKEATRALCDLCVGGNGGMASVGRGEFAICFLSNFYASGSKAGRGDIEINGIFEEIKWNAGKIGPNGDAGRLINERLIKIAGGLIKGKDFLPFRKSNFKHYSTTEILKLNALYWEAVTGEANCSLTDNELKILFIERSFEKTFTVSNSVLVANSNADFVRFTSVEQAVKYYSANLDDLRLELRANQNNPAAIYLHV